MSNSPQPAAILPAAIPAPTESASEAPRERKDSVLTLLELKELKTGDRLIIHTANTIYQFAIVRDRNAVLTTNKQRKPIGFVKLEGSVDYSSDTHYPEHVFIGGAVVFSSQNGAKVQATSMVMELHLERAV